MPSRGAKAAIAAAAVVVAAALVVPLVLVESSPLYRGDPPPVTTAPPVSTLQVKPPAKGVLVGAWVAPNRPTEQQRVAVVGQYEQQLGRKLDIVHHFHSWDDFFPSELDVYVAKRRDQTLMLSWAGTDTKEVAAGKHDGIVRLRARDLAALRVPVLLRWRWEMNRPNLADTVHSPADYIAAWKRVRAIFHEEGADNVDLVWCPLSTNFAGTDAPAYYPGDDEVDWICVDAYTDDPRQDWSAEVEPFLAWAAAHDKPVMVGEFGTQPGPPGQRRRWLAEVATVVRQHPQVKAIVYFDENVDRAGRKRDWSLRSSAGDVRAFGELMAEPYFNPRRLPVRGQ
jgi:hypothetical protein